MYSQIMNLLTVFEFGFCKLTLLKNAGTVTLHPMGVRRSSIVKPLLAIISSPSSDNSKSPDCLTSSLSEIEPWNNALTWIISPEGEMTTLLL